MELSTEIEKSLFREEDFNNNIGRAQFLYGVYETYPFYIGSSKYLMMFNEQDQSNQNRISKKKIKLKKNNGECYLTSRCHTQIKLREVINGKLTYATSLQQIDYRTLYKVFTDIVVMHNKKSPSYNEYIFFNADHIKELLLTMSKDNNNLPQIKVIGDLDNSTVAFYL